MRAESASGGARNARPRSSVSGRVVTVLVLVILTGFSGLLGATAVQRLVTDLTATQTSVTAQVIGEDTERVMEGNSRNRHWVEYRTVSVDYPTANGTQRAVVRSDDARVGGSVTAWVDDGTGEVRLDQPSPPDLWQWIWAVVFVGLTIAFAWGLVVVVRNRPRASISE
ncbi:MULTISPECIES: hypothetical protein [unclassified Plantibacter]|uniref:hypothetical protein n=1 Tax=unclassified Plantibacter TaxID=2624265 RepID=UPI000A8E47FD|nr:MULTISPECIES: hypothetical protein [unclassified Plantibacter]